ncbi:MAG: FAD-binding protein [Halanaerobiales bacterium]
MKRIGVIGGGPAGLTAAIAAAKTGLEVTLWEANEIDKHINCAEGYFDILDNFPPPVEGRKHKVDNLIIQLGEEFELDTSQLNLWMLDREEWQYSLKKKAEKMGVLIYEDEMIQKDQLEFLKSDFNWILDASGTPSVTSLYYDFRNVYLQNALIGVQYKLKGDFSDYYPGLKAVILENEWGYAWIFPKSKQIANVGIGLFNEKGVNLSGRSLFARLNNFLKREKIEAEIIEKAGGICPGSLVESPVIDNIILIGDAAGLTSPLHGGGIELARLSARLAVKAIKEKNINYYPQYLKNKIKEKQNIENNLSHLWKNLDRSNLKKLVSFLSHSQVERSKLVEQIALFKKIGKWKVM